MSEAALLTGAVRRTKYGNATSMRKPGMVFGSADGTLGERPSTLTTPENRSAAEKVG
jgi:hypothetical protein